MTGDFAQIYIFNGHWATDSSTFRNAGTTDLVNPAPDGSSYTWLQQNPTSWLPAASATDYCYIFRPDGTVSTNGLVTYDRAYHILTTSGIGQASGPGGAVAGAIPLSTPSLMGETCTVTLNLDGAVYVQTGVADMAAGAISFIDNPSAGATLGNPQVATALKTPSINGGINITSKGPDIVPAPPDSPVYVAVGGYVTLEAYANDTAQSGQRLYAGWSAQTAPGHTNIGTGASAYSIPLPPTPFGGAMDWDPTANGGNGGWHSTWQWRPPADAQPGDEYELSLVVEDALALHQLASIPPVVVTVSPPGTLLVDGVRPGSPPGLGGELLQVNVDGAYPAYKNVAATNPNNPTYAPSRPWSDDYFKCSADGQRLVFRTSRLLPNLLPGSAPRTIAVTTFPATTTTLLPINGGAPDSRMYQILPSISPEGDAVAYVEYTTAGESACLGEGVGGPGAIGPTPVQFPWHGPGTAPTPVQQDPLCVCMGALYVQQLGPPYQRILVDTNVGPYSHPISTGLDVFPGMGYELFTDSITWDPGGDPASCTLFYTKWSPTPTASVIQAALAPFTVAIYNNYSPNIWSAQIERTGPGGLKVLSGPLDPRVSPPGWVTSPPNPTSILPVYPNPFVGCYAANFPTYGSSSGPVAPYKMTALKWNTIYSPPDLQIWDASSITNPAGIVYGGSAPTYYSYLTQSLPPGFYQNPVFYTLGVTGQDGIVVAGCLNGTPNQFTYTSPLQGCGAPLLYRFTPTAGGGTPSDFTQLIDQATNEPMSAQHIQPAYDPITR